MFVSVNAPVAQPESSNPFASADAGQGCLSGVFLGISLALLGLVTIPPALAIGYLGPGRPLLVVGLVVGSLALDVGLGRWPSGAPPTSCGAGSTGCHRRHPR
ncbi:MAG: hypothetical protein R2704_13460 [Microthrixaceae bacterium]